MRRLACPCVVRHRGIVAIFAWMLLNSSGLAAPPSEHTSGTPAMLAAHLDPVWTSTLMKDPAKPTPWPTSGFMPEIWAEAPGGALVLLGTMYSAGHADRLVLRNAERAGPEAAVPLTLPTSTPDGLQQQRSLFGRTLPPNLYRGIDTIAIRAPNET